MSWLKIDDQFPDHPKVVEAGPLASWLHVCGMAYCARYLTDGFIPGPQVRKLADVPNAQDLAAKLLQAGLWEQVDGGYQVHDYLDYNPSAEEVKARRRAGAKRQEEWRNKQRVESGHYTSNVLQTPLVTPIPSPSPSPIPPPIPPPAPSHTERRETPVPPLVTPDVTDSVCSQPFDSESSTDPEGMSELDYREKLAVVLETLLGTTTMSQADQHTLTSWLRKYGIAEVCRVAELCVTRKGGPPKNAMGYMRTCLEAVANARDPP